MDNLEQDLDGLPILKKTNVSSPDIVSNSDIDGLPILKKKVGTLESSPSGLPLQSQGGLPDFKKGEKIANVGFAMPQSDIGGAIEQDKKVDGSTLAGLYNTLVGSVSSLAGGTAYVSDILSAPIGLPLNVRVANAQADRKKIVDFVEKARSSASTPEFEQQQSKYDITNGVDLQDIKGLAFQAPRTLLDMGIGALTGGASYFNQAINDSQKELEESGNADKLSDSQKVGYLFTQATAQAALEKIGLDQVLKHTGLTKKVGQKIAKEVVDEMVEKGIKATAKDIENAVFNKATKLASKIKNVGLNAGKSFVAEGATEGIQQAASDITKTITNKIAGNDIFNQEDINNNFWKNVVNAGIAGGVMGGVIGGGVGALNNTNKAIRRQIAEVQSPQDLDNLKTQINQQVELGNITPEEAQAANIKAQQYAEIAAKIPTQVSQEDKYKIIGGIDQRNQLNNAIQKSTDEMSNLDESFKGQKQDEIALLQARLNQVNDYINGIVGGKEFDYKENKGEFYKIDSNGNQIQITKQDYDIAKAVQDENKRKEAEQEAVKVEMPSAELAPTKEVTVTEEVKPTEIKNKKERYNTDNGRFVKYNPNDVLPLLKDFNPTNKMAVEDYVIQTIPNDASVEAYKTIPIDAVITSEKIESKDRKKIDKIKEGIKNGDDIPPIVVDFAPVIENGKPYQFGLMDGHHRYIAYKELGIKEIPAAIVTSREHYDYETNDSNISTLFKPTEEVKPTEVKTVEQLRKEEQAELDSKIENAEQYRTDGKVDRSKLTNKKDIKNFDKIYEKYDKLITPLLESQKQEVKPTEEKQIGADIINNTESKTLLPVEEINNLRTQKETDLATGNAIELERDLLKNGIKEPLVVTYYPNEGKARLTDGHNRLDVAKDMGAENLPIRIVYDYGEAPSSAKDFVLPNEEVKPTEVKVKESKSPVTIPEEVFNPIVNKIKKGIQKLSDTAKVSVLKGKNFAKALEEAIKTGDVNLQSWGGFEKKGFEESPQWKKLIDDGTVKLNFDIKGLEGKPVVVINPDNMLTGEVVTKNGKPIVDGNGGINFVTKFGDVWASSDNATANTLARYINEARQKDIDAGGDGTVHVVVTKGDLSKSLTSHTGAKAAMKVLEHFVDKKLVSLSDFRKALTEVGKKYGIDFDGRLDAKAIHDDIAKKFFGVTDSTFSKRGFFVQDMIDHLAKNSKSAKENIAKIRELLNTEALPKSTERKTGEISFAKEGIIDAIGHLLSDNMTVGVKNSEAYATIEIKHPVEVFNLNKEEGGHESYPFHLRQIDENGNKVKPVLNVLNEAKHVTDILNDANNAPVDKKGGAGKFGSNQIGMAKGFVKPASEHPTGVNLMTDATGKIYGFEQNGKIVLNADLMNGNTPFHEAGHLWLSWAKENRSDLHDAGMAKVENSKYLKDVKNNKVYQENASKLPEEEREAYFKSEALAKAIGDNGEKFVNDAQKSDFRKWVKELWETIATHFGLRDMTPEQISNMTLDDFSKKVVADIVGKESEKEAKLEVEAEEKVPVEFSVDELYKQLPKAKNLRESAQKRLISSNFDKIVDQLIKNDKIQKKC